MASQVSLHRYYSVRQARKSWNHRQNGKHLKLPEDKKVQTGKRASAIQYFDSGVSCFRTAASDFQGTH